ncbi:regulatory protein RecX [Geoalkalibacter sp.]|uniref:regulatory protein RecX n=1 Tax=Geoalkalibacter sp. TaxID=3041440 RepID=UPI00272DF6DF|nr:regulatory protein RecX [Geoalkalibacter sp.]
MSASEPLALALRLLAARDRSQAELAAALERRGIAASDIAEVLERCRELGYVDDRRYALERARALLRDGRAAGARIRLDLRRRGIDPELAQEALRAAEVEAAPEQVLRELLARRFPDFDYARAEARDKRRVIAFLQRRGFSPAQIFALFREEKDL